MNRIRLKEAGWADIGPVVRLNGEAELGYWNQNSFLRLVQDPEADFLVAELDGQFAGFCLSLAIVPEMEVVKLAVCELFRHRGIGAALLRESLQRGRARQCRQCFLEVRCSNELAIDFYRRNGFAELNVRKDYYVNPVEDALVMFRIL